MPVAYKHIFRYHIHCPVSIIHAGLPHSHSCCPSVNEPVAPYPQLPVVLCQVITNGGHFPGKQFSVIMATAPCATVVANIKYFVHPGMKGIRFKGIADFINQVKNNFMHSGM